MKLDINIIAYSPLRGSSYIELPKELAVKKAIINMKNEDDQCFKWAVTRALNPVDKNAADNRLYRVSKHPTGCQTGCQTGLTTGLTTVLNEQTVRSTLLSKRLYNLV